MFLGCDIKCILFVISVLSFCFALSVAKCPESAANRGNPVKKIRNKTLQKYQKNSRRLELSVSKNTPHGRWGQGPGSVGPRFPAGLPFPVPQILEFVAMLHFAIREFFPAIFPVLSRSFPREPPNRPQKQPQPSRVF